MSDTLETDAAKDFTSPEKLYRVARKLERERNALADRLKRAEAILSRLADGYPVAVLDRKLAGEQMGQRVLEYWRWVEKREGK